MNSLSNLQEAILDPDLRYINFFNGRLLSGEDLSAERDATRALGRHLGQAIGVGVAFGLEVAKAPDSPPTDTQVLIKAGLAVNREGQVLKLQCDQTLSLVEPPDPAAKADCVFTDCTMLESGSTLSVDGVYVLTIAPASQREGLAPISGLGNDPAPCNSKYFTEGVQFRLLPLNVTPNPDATRVRNEVAFQCFGIPARTADQFASDALSELDAAEYGLESLVAGSQLTDQDVPLAILQWSKNGGLNFLDRWAVRRRIIRPEAAESWSYFMDYRRRAESEAIFQQFQEQLSDIQQEAGVPPAFAAEQRLKYLPPAGLLTVGGNNFNWSVFLGAHAPNAEIPLGMDHARALLWRALGEEPVTVLASKDAGKTLPPPVPFHVYRLSGQVGQPGMVLFIRSGLNEILAEDVYCDNSACGLGGAQTVQAAIDFLCKNHGCECTVVARPGDKLQDILNKSEYHGGHTVICLLPGKYELTEPLKLGNAQSHFTLKACQPGTAGFSAKSGQESKFAGGLIALRNASNVTLDGLTLNAPPVQAGKGLASMGLSVENCANLTIENCLFKFHVSPKLVVDGAGILAVGNCTGLTLRDNQFSGPASEAGAYFGLLVIGTEKSWPVLDQALLRGNQFSGLTVAALTASNSGVFNAQENTVTNCLGGFWLTTYRSEQLVKELAVVATDQSPVFQRIPASLGNFSKLIEAGGGVSAGSETRSQPPSFHLANNRISSVWDKPAAGDSGYALLVATSADAVLPNSSAVLASNELRANWFSTVAVIAGVKYVSITGNLILNTKTPLDATSKNPLSLGIFPENKEGTQALEVALAVVGNVMNCHSNVGPGYVPRRDIQPIVSGQGTEFLAQLNTWKFANFEPQPVP